MINIVKQQFPQVIQSGNLIIEYTDDVHALLDPYFHDSGACLMQFGCDVEALGAAIAREKRTVDVGLKIFYRVSISGRQRYQAMPGAHIQIVKGSDGSIAIHGGAPNFYPHCSISWLRAFVLLLAFLFDNELQVVYTNSRKDNQRVARILAATGFKLNFTRYFVPTPVSPNTVDQLHFRASSVDFYCSRFVKKLLSPSYRTNGIVHLKPVRFSVNDERNLIDKATEKVLRKIQVIAAEAGAIFVTPDAINGFDAHIINNTVVRELIFILNLGVESISLNNLSDFLKKNYSINPTRYFLLLNGNSILAAFSIFANVSYGTSLQLSLSVCRNCNEINFIYLFLTNFLFRIFNECIDPTRIQFTIKFDEDRLDVLLGDIGFRLEEMRDSFGIKVFGFLGLSKVK